jgi:hypothetical protein
LWSKNGLDRNMGKRKITVYTNLWEQEDVILIDHYESAYNNNNNNNNNRMKMD